jgi:hypothetical protein
MKKSSIRFADYELRKNSKAKQAISKRGRRRATFFNETFNDIFDGRVKTVRTRTCSVTPPAPRTERTGHSAALPPPLLIQPAPGGISIPQSVPQDTHL